jgi:RimJ/RimL family protein N-acetyltransferase
MCDVELRDVAESDVLIFFEQQRDPAANQIAAFTAKNPADKVAFAAKWAKIHGDDAITKKTVLFEAKVAGNVVAFVAPWSGKLEVSCWLGREFWGKGIATTALNLDDRRRRGNAAMIEWTFGIIDRQLGADREERDSLAAC